MIEVISDNLLLLGIVSGLLQLLGYVLYLNDDSIEPNPVSWFMFAYGTALLTVMEWDKNATFAELILPTVCSVLGIYVSFRCWQKSRKLNPKEWWPRDWWPEDLLEKWSFISDIIITIGYVGAWLLATYALITEEYRVMAVFAFLFLSNLSTIPSFYPILRSTYLYPHKESYAPWLIWAAAYAILGLVTYFTHGELVHILMMYPVISAVMHALVGLLALRRIESRS